MRDTFIKSLVKLAKEDSRIILVTGDLGFGVVDEFQRELPNQFINSGINEQAMMGLSAGYASQDYRVFVYSIGNFPTLRCLEQIRNDVCYMNNPVVIVSVGAGYAYGSQGYTHHAIEDVAVMRALPNMEVVIPADAFEVQGLTAQIAQSNYPTYLRLGKSGEDSIHSSTPRLEYGKPIVVRGGKDGTILFIGSVGKIALQAAEYLSDKGYSIEVSSVPYVSRIDSNYLKERAEIGPIITLEEHSIQGGFGSAVLETCSNENLKANVKLIGARRHNLSEIGSQNYLRFQNGISVEAVVDTFMNALVNSK
jgi:transketolase